MVWYLVSDSVQAKQVASALYGGPSNPRHVLLANTNATVGHTGTLGRWRPHESSTYHGADAEILLRAIGEMFMLSLTDYQVLSGHSGFGTKGALWSNRVGSYCQLYRATNSSTPCKPCT